MGYFSKFKAANFWTWILTRDLREPFKKLGTAQKQPRKKKNRETDKDKQRFDVFRLGAGGKDVFYQF